MKQVTVAMLKSEFDEVSESLQRSADAQDEMIRILGLSETDGWRAIIAELRRLKSGR